MSKLPKLKKKVHSFLTKEDGKITKENLIKTGVLVGIVGFGSLSSLKSVESFCPPDDIADKSGFHVDHCNGLSLEMEQTAQAGHAHETHGSHSSHSSHGSHGSHSSW